MDTAELIQTGEILLQPWAGTFTHPETNRSDVSVSISSLKEAVNALMQAHWGYLAAITGLDHPAPAAVEGQEGTQPGDNNIEVLYHFCNGSAVVTLRILVPYANPILPSICDLIPSATLYERELREMFGIEIEGTPVKDHLLLPDDWPDGVYPLRKSFTGFGPTTQA